MSSVPCSINAVIRDEDYNKLFYNGYLTMFQLIMYHMDKMSKVLQDAGIPEPNQVCRVFINGLKREMFRGSLRLTQKPDDINSDIELILDPRLIEKSEKLGITTYMCNNISKICKLFITSNFSKGFTSPFDLLLSFKYDELQRIAKKTVTTIPPTHSVCNFCHACGLENKRKGLFCSSCGANLSEIFAL
jgi:hypothetical protein